MHQILIVEDDPALSQGIRLALGQEGRQFVQAGTIGQAERELAERTFDLLILDLNLPDGNGLELLTEIRSVSQVPVLILTANDLESDQVTGLELGADDYITKPFSVRELLARVKANIRRVSMAVKANQEAAPAAKPDGDTLRLGRVSIDRSRATVSKDGQPLDLTQREYDLICFLAAQPGKVFSREALMEHVWNYEGYVGDVRAVDVAVRRLREKIEDDPASPRFIVTKRGMGYFFAG